MYFRKLITPVIIAVAVSIVAFVGFGFIAAKSRDAESFSAERKVVGRTITAYREQLAVLAEDNAWWDVAIEHILLKEDIAWIDATLGESVDGIKQVQGVIVLRPDASVIYSRFDAGLPAPHLIVDAVLSRLPAIMPKTNGHTPSTVSGLARVQGDLLAFGASRLTQTGAIDFKNSLPEKRPLIVFLGHMTPAILKELGDNNAIQHLRFSAPGTDKGKAMLAAYDPFGAALGGFTWRASRPGMQLVRDMAVPALALLLVVVMSLGYFFRRASKMVDQLAQADRAKSAFLASMSHEIRTPLNAIIGFTELVSLELYGKVEGKKNKEYLKLIRDSGQHLLTIINDILDISKLEAGRYDIYAETVNPAEEVAACLKIVASNAIERNVTLVNECEDGSIKSDARIIRQVVLNILSNAVKFTGSGGQVTIAGHPAEDGYVITVRDTGIGMSRKDIEIAMSLFGQIQSDYARSHAGTGLGLPLVHRFMTLLDGSMDIQSTPGEGTCITLTFPCNMREKNLPDVP
ncbi:sensor histidine kinase [Kordiimonas marina]|uniref:sensor histidine kinase n=1 Tax=Kordiimonas marina TaxID=2872312 RepID=UPI001FF2E813|nr:ATP-binding protein [Kordiimonas marina]MCJ9428162.1 hypothetical protein [Kordiimonas marina]